MSYIWLLYSATQQCLFIKTIDEWMEKCGKVEDFNPNWSDLGLYFLSKLLILALTLLYYVWANDITMRSLFRDYPLGPGTNTS